MDEVFKSLFLGSVGGASGERHVDDLSSALMSWHPSMTMDDTLSDTGSASRSSISQNLVVKEMGSLSRSID